MNAVNYAIEYIKDTIDDKVLNLAFQEKDRVVDSVLSLEEKIRSQVIVSKVFRDIKYMSSIRIVVPLNNCRVKQVPELYEFIVEVPMNLTKNREIVSLVSVLVYSPGSIMGDRGNHMLNVASAMLSSALSSSSLELSRLELIGKNVFVMEAETYIPMLQDTYLVCNIASNTNMTHILPGSYRNFAKLCSLAAKSKIYQKLYVSLDEGYIKGGHAISRVKDIVDNFADSETLYDEELIKWSRIEKMNNRKLNADIISLQT